MKLLSIFLSVFILTQGIWMNTNELEKVEVLLEHAKYHKDQYGDSFSAFLSKHYGNLKQKHDQEQQEERHDHEQLPFQQTLQLAAQPVFLLDSYSANFSLPIFAESENENYFYKQLHGSLIIKEILQPPKIA